MGEAKSRWNDVGDVDQSDDGVTERLQRREEGSKGGQGGVASGERRGDDKPAILQQCGEEYRYGVQKDRKHS